MYQDTIYLYVSCSVDVSAANTSALPNRRVLEWKFSELDADSDGHLNRNEVQSLRYMVVKLVHPRSCAQSFHNYCDLDNNKLIALKEWTDCLSGSTAVSNISMGRDYYLIFEVISKPLIMIVIINVLITGMQSEKRQHPLYRTEAPLDVVQMSKRHLDIWQFCLFILTG